jgi:hypothetical protein
MTLPKWKGHLFMPLQRKLAMIIQSLVKQEVLKSINQLIRKGIAFGICGA